MELKKCTKCGYDKNIEEFAWRNKAKKIRQSWCRECRKRMDRESYQCDKQKFRKKTDKFKKSVREYFEDYKLKKRCCVCGYNKCVTCLDFHHLSPETKKITISDAIRKGWSIKRVLKEVEKCVVICKNHHGELHKNLINL